MLLATWTIECVGVLFCKINLCDCLCGVYHAHTPTQHTHYTTLHYSHTHICMYTTHTMHAHTHTRTHTHTHTHTNTQTHTHTHTQAKAKSSATIKMVTPTQINWGACALSRCCELCWQIQGPVLCRWGCAMHQGDDVGTQSQQDMDSSWTFATHWCYSWVGCFPS